MIDEVYLDRIGGRIVTLVEYHQERQRRRVEQIPVFCTECKHRAVPYDPADLEKPRGFRHFGSPDQGRPWCLKGDNGRRGGEVVWRLSADIARVVKADGSLHSMPERWALVRMFLDSRKPTHGGPLLFSEAALGQLAGQAGWRCRREAERLRGLLAA